MKLVLLGTSGYHPSDRRQTSCMVLPSAGAVLDAGTGMFRLGRYLQTDEVDIFITHAHLDHVVGLSYLFSVNWEHPLRRMTIHGRSEKLYAIERHLFYRDLSARPPFDLRSLKPNTMLADGGRLTHFSLDHPGGSLGYRIDWPGHSMAYVTDTTAAPDAAYVEKIRGVDLLIHECFYPTAAPTWRPDTATVASRPRRGSPGRRRGTSHPHPHQPVGRSRVLRRSFLSPKNLPQHRSGRRSDGSRVLNLRLR